MSSKYPLNEQFIKELSSPQFDEAYQVSERNDQAKSVCIEYRQRLAQIENDFREKFCQDVYSVRRYFFNNQPTKIQEASSGESMHRGSKPDFKDKESYCKDTNFGEYALQLKGEQYGRNFLTSQIHENESDSKLEIEQMVYNKHREELNKQNPVKLSLKDQRGDGFLNRPTRSMTIAAFLRCLYASIEYAPSWDMKDESLNTLRDIKLFRTITQLCDCTDFDEGANIGAKYLRVMRSVITLPRNKNDEDLDMMMHYELLSFAIKKILNKIIMKMKKDIEMTDGDQITIFEVSQIFYTITIQANNLIFSTLDLSKLHKENELRIQEIERLKNPNPQDWHTPSGKKPMKKCEFHDHPDFETEETFMVDEPSLRNELSC